MDLTAPLYDDRRRRRSTTTQDKEAISNMRIVSSLLPPSFHSLPEIPLTPCQQRRRAQNRASQRAFRERKEKHVQQLERQLEELEAKHRTLTQSYTTLDSTHGQLKQEVEQLRGELISLTGASFSSSSSSTTVSQSRENSAAELSEAALFDQFAVEGLFDPGQGITF